MAILNKEAIDRIRKVFDLNQYEVNIWIHILSKGVSTAGELSEISNVPRSRAYDVLESLERKNFVVIKIGKPIQYIAIPPEEVINRVKKRIRNVAEEKIRQLDNFKESNTLNELNNLYNKGIKTYAPSELSGAFRGRENIYTQMESMIRNAENSVKIVTTEEGVIRKLSVLKEVIRKAHERGVSIEVEAPLTERNKDTIDSLRDFINFKSISNPDARYCVVDDKQALLMLLNDKDVHPNYDVGVWLNSESVSKLLSNLQRIQ